MAPYKAPEFSSSDLTTQLVRAELLKCFESANREFADMMNQQVSDEVLKQQVLQFVTTVFASCGASFDDPTKEGITTAIGQCKKNAEAMMGPQGAGIVTHHYSEMMKLVNRLPE